MKNIFVGFFEVVFAHGVRQTLDEGIFFLNVELLADVDALFDVVGNAPLELDRETVLIAELPEGLEVLALLDVLRPDVADERAHPVDVVGEAHHAHDLDEDQAHCLLVVGRH